MQYVHTFILLLLQTENAMKMIVLLGRNGRHGVSVAQHAEGELVKGKGCANSQMERMFRQLNVVERIRKRRHAMKINALVSRVLCAKKSVQSLYLPYLFSL